MRSDRHTLHSDPHMEKDLGRGLRLLGEQKLPGMVVTGGGWLYRGLCLSWVLEADDIEDRIAFQI